MLLVTNCQNGQNLNRKKLLVSCLTFFAKDINLHSLTHIKNIIYIQGLVIKIGISLSIKLTLNLIQIISIHCLLLITIIVEFMIRNTKFSTC